MSLRFDLVTLINLYISSYREATGNIHLRKGLVCHQLFVSNILSKNVKCKNVKYKNVKSKVMFTEAHLKPS